MLRAAESMSAFSSCCVDVDTPDGRLFATAKNK